MRNKVIGDVNQNMKTYQSPETFIFYRCIVDLILVDLKIILFQNDDLNSLDKFMAYIRNFYKKLIDLFQWDIHIVANKYLKFVILRYLCIDSRKYIAELFTLVSHRAKYT